MSEASETLFDALLAVSGVRILFFFSANSFVQVDAVRGRSRMFVQNTSGAIIETPSADFLVRARDLKSTGGPIEPQRGNWIILPGETAGSQFELMTPPYDPASHDGTILRLHTKLTQGSNVGADACQ